MVSLKRGDVNLILWDDRFFWRRGLLFLAFSGSK